MSPATVLEQGRQLSRHRRRRHRARGGLRASRSRRKSDLPVQPHSAERGSTRPRDPRRSRRAARHTPREVRAGTAAERHRLHCAGVCDDDGRARPGRAVPPVVPLQRGCWRRRGHGVQARGDPAAEIGQDGGGRQVALSDGDRGASRAGLQAFELWTGRRCPRTVVSRTVLAAYQGSA